jgi:hypothetical protein
MFKEAGLRYLCLLVGIPMAGPRYLCLVRIPILLEAWEPRSAAERPTTWPGDVPLAPKNTDRVEILTRNTEYSGPS